MNKCINCWANPLNLSCIEIGVFQQSIWLLDVCMCAKTSKVDIIGQLVVQDTSCCWWSCLLNHDVQNTHAQHLPFTKGSDILFHRWTSNTKCGSPGKCCFLSLLLLLVASASEWFLSTMLMTDDNVKVLRTCLGWSFGQSYEQLRSVHVEIWILLQRGSIQDLGLLPPPPTKALLVCLYRKYWFVCKWLKQRS